MQTVECNKLDRIWFQSFCKNEEIDRIISPENAVDYLLQERANIVADNTRFLRVYIHKARFFPDWSFEKSFSTSHYIKVIDNLSKDDKEKCKDITYGDMFSNDVNGYASKDPVWGRLIYLNESLNFFIKFCNLALFDFKMDVPDHIRLNSLRIAIRTVFKKEAMDFFMDPRGIVPEHIATEMLAPLPYELQYIAGHEFAHHLCNHLDDNKMSERTILSTGEKEYTKQVYNTSQLQEFEADIASITRPQYSCKETEKLLEAALIWFISLELSEAAYDYVCPTSSYSSKTHPSAKDRFENIIKNVRIPPDFDLKKIEKIRERSKWLKDKLIEDLSFNYELYDFYGSVYLDKPNTQWRGKELIDRVDY